MGIVARYSCTLDAWNKIHPISVHAVQGEISSRFVDISLTDKNSPLNLTNKTVAVYMTKPDKTLIFNNCTIKDNENGVVTMALTSQMSAIAGIIKDVTFHVIGNDKSLLKVTGMYLDIESSPDQSEAIESTNEFTALVEALQKADESLEYVTLFLKEKGQEIDQIVSQKMQNVDNQMETINENASAQLEDFKNKGNQAISSVNTRFDESMAGFTQQVTGAVTSANQATQAAQQATAKVEADGAQAISTINQNFSTAMTGFNQEIDAAVKKAEDAAGAAEETAEQTAISTINAQKNQANGIAGLDGSGKLIQMPTAEEVGAAPTSRTINGKPLTGNITLTVEDIGTNAIFLVSHPVGSLFETTVSTNPGTLYGGTWAAWGGGRVPVGVNTADSDFNTVEKTGGKKTERHEFKIGYKGYYGTTVGSDDNMIQAYKYSTSSYGTYAYEGSTQAGVNAGIQAAANTMEVAQASSTGDTSATSIVQPYITCYIWKRTT